MVSPSGFFLQQHGLILCSLLTVLSLHGVTVAAEDLKLRGQTMGTYYSIVIDNPVGEEGELRAAVEARLAELNRQMSTWIPDSEISRFNSDEGNTEWFPVSRDFAVVVAAAKEIHKQSGGVFDPTVAPLIDLWGFGTERPPGPPTDGQIEEALEQIGLQDIEVREAPPQIRRRRPGLTLNLSAIAKGLSVDEIGQVLRDSGNPSFIVDIGGENLAGEPRADGTLWKVGIENPSGGLRHIVRLSQQAIATSGDYRNFFMMNGRRYAHTIDPRTGRPVENPPASVSVIAGSCMEADAWATALSVLNAEEGIPAASAANVEAFFLNETAADRYKEDMTDGFPAGEASVPQTAQPESVQQAQASDDKSGSSLLTVVLLVAGIMALAITGMAVGVIFRNKSIEGSCGGLANMPGAEKSPCELCAIPRDECVNAEVREQLQADDSGNQTAS